MATPRKKPAPKKKPATGSAKSKRSEPKDDEVASTSSREPMRGVMDMTPPEFAERAKAEQKAADETALVPAPPIADEAADILPDPEEPVEAPPVMPTDEPDFGLGIGDILRSEEEEIIGRKRSKKEKEAMVPTSTGDDSDKMMIDDILHRSTEKEEKVRPSAILAPRVTPRAVAAPAPMRAVRRPSPRDGRIKSIILVLLVLICFAAAATGVYVFLKKSGTSIFPIGTTNSVANENMNVAATVPEDTAPKSVLLTFVTGPGNVETDSVKLFVPSRVIESDVQGSDTFPATDEAKVTAGSASGKITITNTTANKYTFVKTTRLLSADGVLFRLKSSTMIPPNGSVEAEVMADQPGPEGDIGPTNFTIPGLPADLQKRITGKSIGAMTGGSGTAKAASKVDIAAGNAALDAKLKAEALDNFAVMIEAGELLHPDLVTSKELSATVPPVGTVGSTFTIKESLRFRVLLIPEKEIANELAKKLKDALPAGASISDYALGDATYMVQAYDAAKETAEIKVEVLVNRQ